MFGFGYKDKTEKIVYEELGHSVTRMNASLFGNYVSRGKAHGQNEYSTAIEFVLDRLENLEAIWSEDTGKVTSEDIINNIQGVCTNIIRIIPQSNADESSTLVRIEELQDKVR